MPALTIDGRRYELADDQDPAAILATAQRVMLGQAGPTGLTGIRLADGTWQAVHWQAVATVIADPPPPLAGEAEDR